MELYAQAGPLMPVAVVTVMPQEQTEPIILTVHPDVGVTLTGTVVDDHGQPVAGAEVMISWNSPGWGTGLIARERSDAQGHFRSEPECPLYSYHAQVSAPGHAPAQSERWTAKPGQTHEFNPIVLIATRGVVAGRVSDADGNPISGVRVYNRGDGAEEVSTTTDDQGQFRLEGLFEGPVWVFAEADGYQFGGAATEASSDDVLITLSPPDATPELGPPIPMPRQVDVQKDHEIAMQLISEALEIMDQSGPSSLEYMRPNMRQNLVCRLAILDTNRALALSAAAGGTYDRPIYRALSEYLIYDDPDQALHWIYKLGDDFARFELLPRAARQLIPTQPDRAREIIDYLLGEALVLEEEEFRPAFVAIMADLLWELDPGEAETWLRRAAEMADDLPYTPMGASARGWVAMKLARIDLPAALSLMDELEYIETPDDFIEQHTARLVLEIATTDPERVEDLLKTLDDREYARKVPEVCYRMAAVYPDRAIRLARTIEEDYMYGGGRAVALGAIGYALAPTDPQRAVQLIQEAAQDLSDYPYSAAHGGLAAACAVLAQIAAEIGWSQTDSLVLRALSLRSATIWPYDPKSRDENTAALAMRLAFVDPQAARQLLDCCWPPGTHARWMPPGGYDYLHNALRAATIIDPDLAVEMLQEIPETGQYAPGMMPGLGPRVDGHPEPVKLQAYWTVTDYLTTPPSRRRIEVMSKYGLWAPGVEPKWP